MAELGLVGMGACQFAAKARDGGGELLFHGVLGGPALLVGALAEIAIGDEKDGRGLAGGFRGHAGFLVPANHSLSPEPFNRYFAPDGNAENKPVGQMNEFRGSSVGASARSAVERKSERDPPATRSAAPHPDDARGCNLPTLPSRRLSMGLRQETSPSGNFVCTGRFSH
jgi:hypothetical protein